MINGGDDGNKAKKRDNNGKFGENMEKNCVFYEEISTFLLIFQNGWSIIVDT